MRLCSLIATTILLLASRLASALPSNHPERYHESNQPLQRDSSQMSNADQYELNDAYDHQQGYYREDESDCDTSVQSESDSESDDDPQDFLHEPNSPVLFNAFYPYSDKIRHLRFTEETMKDYPIHPEKDTRRAFCIRNENRPPNDDWEGAQKTINNDLVKQRAFYHLKKNFDKDRDAGFYYSPHSAVYYSLNSRPKQIRRAFWDDQLPILRKSKRNGTLRFTFPNDKNHVLPQDDDSDGGPDSDYTGEYSDEDTEHLY